MNSGSIKNMVNLHGSITSLGARGYSNYEIAVQNGFEGTEQEWLDSLVGPVGPRGPIGPNNFHVGEEEPEDENVSVWLDTDEPIPNTFVPVATEETLGTIKPGNNLKVDKNGKLEMTIYASNVEEMVNSKLKPQDVVRTLGYYEPNDGGGALYLIREKTESDVEDGGSIHFVADNLVAELITNNEINVKQFGAKGDGISDDTESIQNAIEYVKKLKKKSHCLNINPGIYTVSNTIESPLYIKFITMGNVQINYSGEGSLFHLYNTEEMSDMYEDLDQNPYNVGNVLDGSKGVFILRGTGKNNEQIALKLGEESEGIKHRTTTAWANFTNVYIEKFGKGIYFTNYQNYIMRFYNVCVSNCAKGITNSEIYGSNSGELIAFIACSLNNNDVAVEINEIIDFNFDNCSIDYNREGIIINYSQYQAINLTNCWLEGNNVRYSNDTCLIKSNVDNFLPTVNISKCFIYPKNGTAWTLFKGKMFMNINDCTLKVNRLKDGNFPEGQFIFDEQVKVNSFNGFKFADNTILTNTQHIINENWDFSAEALEDGSIPGFDFTPNKWGNTHALSEEKFYTGSKSLKVTAGEPKYVSFKTNKFNVSRLNKIIGNLLFYINTDEVLEHNVNCNMKVKFYNGNDEELTSNLFEKNENTKYETKKFVLLGFGISNENDYIKIPNEAVKSEIEIILGNLTYDIYIDNVAVTGL